MWIKLTECNDFDPELRELDLNMDWIVSMARSEGVTTLVGFHGDSYEVIQTVEQIFEDMRNAVS